MTEYYKHKCACNHPDCGGLIAIKSHHKYQGIPRFIFGHHNKGKKRSEETRKKISGSMKGKKDSEETRRRKSDAKIGPKNPNYGKDFSGKNSPMYGKKHSEETKKKMSDNHADFSGPNHPQWKGGLKEYICQECGEKFEDRKYKKMRKFCSKKCDYIFRSKNYVRENSSNWKGGVSFDPYLPEFNGKLKESIRDRDKRTCQKCGKTEKEIGQKLDIHHIDYDKENNDPEWLISLCRSCNSKVNKNRTYWTYHFEVVQRLKIKKEDD